MSHILANMLLNTYNKHITVQISKWYHYYLSIKDIKTNKVPYILFFNLRYNVLF